jgi:transcriptional regulator EpsA
MQLVKSLGEAPRVDDVVTAEEAQSLQRIAAEALTIERHAGLAAWLGGDLQRFLPHDVLVWAWRGGAGGRLKIELASRLPGIGHDQRSGCRIDLIAKECYLQWLAERCRPLVLTPSAVPALRAPCACPLHRTLRGVRLLLVHGFRDNRGDDSLYIALDCEGRLGSRRQWLAQLLLCQIDAACRRAAREPAAAGALRWLNVSARESEILDCLYRGKSNLDIAATLGISHFTVKNHVQRIFRKIGVSNRTHAAAKYSQAVLESGHRLDA